MYMNMNPINNIIDLQLPTEIFEIIASMVDHKTFSDMRLMCKRIRSIQYNRDVNKRYNDIANLDSDYKIK